MARRRASPRAGTRFAGLRSPDRMGVDGHAPVRTRDPEIGDDAMFRPTEQVMASVVDGETVLLRLDTATYFGLNTMGTRVWEGFTSARTIGETVREICRRFDVAPHRVRDDVASLVAELLDEGLIVGADRCD